MNGQDVVRAIKLLPTTARAAVQIARAHRGHHGRIPNLWNPRTFNEKIQWMKLFNRDPRMPIYANKIAVKQLVAEKIGEHWIIPTLWSGDNPANIPFAKLSPPYVIKTNQGSGTNYFVYTVADIRPDEIRDVMAGRLQSNQGLYFHEWHYLAITPGILIEPILDVHGEIPPDFRFFVFSGKVHFIQYDRATDCGYRPFFDTNWQQQPFSFEHRRIGSVPPEIPRPPHLSEMISAAEEIGGEFSFARVDLYDVPQGPKFGEVTFAPGAGHSVFNPPEIDRLFGDLWKLPDRHWTQPSRQIPRHYDRLVG
jgi:hypothetical protein